jgi:hypothetical protein
MAHKVAAKEKKRPRRKLFWPSFVVTVSGRTKLNQSKLRLVRRNPIRNSRLSFINREGHKNVSNMFQLNELMIQPSNKSGRERRAARQTSGATKPLGHMAL